MKNDEWYPVRLALDLIYAGELRNAMEQLLPLIGVKMTVDEWIEHQKVIRRCSGCTTIEPHELLTRKESHDQ